MSRRVFPFLQLVLAFLLCAVPSFATVTVTSPTNGAQVSSPVHYVATATTTCTKGVASMGIYINNVLSYVTYTASLNTSLSFNAGSYSTVVEEWDNCGGATYTPINIIVGTGQTGVFVTSPAPNSTVTSPVTYKATAATYTCAAGVAAMGIYVNNKLTYDVYAASLNTTLTLAPGAYNTVVEEWDNCGGAAYTSVPITVATSGSTGVTVTAPAANSTVTSPVTYTATATTSTCAAGVAAMGIYVNNQLIYSTNGASLNTQISMAAGPEHTVVEEWDKCGGAAYTTVNLTVASSAPTSIAITPSGASFAKGSTQQFTATAKYSNGTTANVTSTATWSVANTAVATINSTGLAAATASGTSSVRASLDGVTGSSPFTVTIAPGTGVNIATWHTDNQRTGLNAGEASLTPTNISAQTFGKLFSYLVDGYVYGEPLLMSNVTINGSVHNVLYVATERDSVYAFDADSFGNPLWHVSLLQAGESPVTGGTILPFEGVTSTPVIDPATNTLYAVSEATGSNGYVSFRLNALDITTGAQKFGGPATITASVPGTNSYSANGVLSLPQWCVQRAALLLANNSVYIGFGNCQTGWLLAYDAHTLAQKAVFNTSPNLNGEGPYGDNGGIWMGGAGPAADTAGNIYVTTGNGPWDGKTAFGDSVLKFSPTLQLEDYFTPDDYAFLNCYDVDLAAGGISLIPGTTLAVAAGKLGKLYVVNTTNLGKEQAGDAGAVQTLWFESDLSAPYSFSCTDATGAHPDNASSYEIFGTSAYFNGAAYLGMSPTASGVPSGIRQFPISGNTLSWGPYTSPGVQVYTLGTTPFLSSNGTSEGVLWMIDQGQPLQSGGPNPPTSATLRAYDASDVSKQLYNSSTNSADVPGYGIKFTSPVVGNGKVYISTGHNLTTATNPQGEVDVYGLH